MEPRISVRSEAVEDLPESLQGPLLRFVESQSEKDLSTLIHAALSDFSGQALPSELPEDANFIQDLGLDSLAITEFVFFFEDVFNLKISNDDLASLGTVGALKGYLLEKLVP